MASGDTETSGDLKYMRIFKIHY